MCVQHMKDYFSTRGVADTAMLQQQMQAQMAQKVPGFDMSQLDSGAMQQLMSMSTVDIFPVTVPTRARGWLGVNVYSDDKGVSKNLPVNQRAVHLAAACGYSGQQYRGDCFIGRVFDDEVSVCKSNNST